MDGQTLVNISLFLLRVPPLKKQTKKPESFLIPYYIYNIVYIYHFTSKTEGFLEVATERWPE